MSSLSLRAEAPCFISFSRGLSSSGSSWILNVAMPDDARAGWPRQVKDAMKVAALPPSRNHTV